MTYNVFGGTLNLALSVCLYFRASQKCTYLLTSDRSHHCISSIDVKTFSCTFFIRVTLFSFFKLFNVFFLNFERVSASVLSKVAPRTRVQLINQGCRALYRHLKDYIPDFQTSTHPTFLTSFTLA